RRGKRFGRLGMMAVVGILAIAAAGMGIWIWRSQQPKGGDRSGESSGKSTPPSKATASKGSKSETKAPDPDIPSKKGPVPPSDTKGEAESPEPVDTPPSKDPDPVKNPGGDSTTPGPGKEEEEKFARAAALKAKGEWKNSAALLLTLSEDPALAARAKAELAALERAWASEGETCLTEGDLTGAASIFEDLAASFPEGGFSERVREIQSRVLLKEGQDLLAIGKMDEAIDRFQKAVDLGVDDRAKEQLFRAQRGLWKSRAEKFERIKYWVGAKFYYEKILDLDPDDEEIKGRLSRLANRAEYEKAMDTMDTAFSRGDYKTALQAARYAVPLESEEGPARKAVVYLEPMGDMVYIPPGPYRMGDDFSYPEEKPSHMVNLPAFCIDRNEVTVGAYGRFLETPAGVGHVPKNWRAQRLNSEKPIVGITLADAEAYAESLGLEIPTEAYWERAARGVNGHEWPWGAEFMEGFANTKEGVSRGAVGVKKFERDRAPSGCLNMGGNVAEWTRSPFAPYPGGKADFPKGQITIRGGDFTQGKRYARCVSRRGAAPAARENHIGFRCIRTITIKSLRELK
ncbi:MAG: SUMF1/EgtB/PvdO family nonheme iron enzyme, partial [Planctomycetota bacterium]